MKKKFVHANILGRRMLCEVIPSSKSARRVKLEACALKIYEQLERIQSEAIYCGQVQQDAAAVEAEFCLQVADIIQKELHWD